MAGLYCRSNLWTSEIRKEIGEVKQCMMIWAHLKDLNVFPSHVVLQILFRSITIGTEGQSSPT
jgi:hypothetical protein